MWSTRQVAGLFLMRLTMACTANATVYSTSPSTIGAIDSYTQFGNGDVVFRLTNNTLEGSCPAGFWIRGTDAGSKTVIAQVISASTTGASVIVGADTSTVWPGAGSAACLVWDVVLQPQ